LNTGIERGTSCASVLVIPRRKTALVRSLRVRWPWPNFELHRRPWGRSPEREEMGEGRGRGGARGHGVELLGGGQPLLLRLLSVVREEKEKKEKKRKGKRKKWKIC
jgi:hypothetical protein